MIASAPVDAPIPSYLSYIEHIPPEDGPQMFGMHASVSETRCRLSRHNAKDVDPTYGVRMQDVAMQPDSMKS